MLAILERTFPDGDYDTAEEYGEPGYRFRVTADTETPLVVMANWWCKCGKVREPAPESYLREDAPAWMKREVDENGTRPALHAVDSHHPRVWAQLEAQGLSAEWSDEWLVDWDAPVSKAYRTQPDSYSWQPVAIVTEDGFILTPDTDVSEWIAWARNDYTRCIPEDAISTSQLEAQGFREFVCDLESGWYGREDSPEDYAAEIRRQHGEDAEFLFHLTSVEQFRINFCAFYRAPAREGICRHCGRVIVTDESGAWIDPAADGDDWVWRESCEGNDEFLAIHEPEGEE